jgi:hypothetical protein
MPWGHRLRWSHICIAVASAGALAAAITIYGNFSDLRTKSISAEIKRPLSTRLSDLAFSVRFPERRDFHVSTTEVEQEFQRAKSQLAQAMRTETLPPGDASLERSATITKVPLPRDRPLASRLMANVGAVSLPNQTSASTDPLTNVSTALRKVFAMLQPSEQVVASAWSEGGISSDGKDNAPPTLAEKQAALYDISARTVYMPDGTRLEAHSGLAELMDDPAQVHVRNRGATPPQIYELTMREKPFYGDEALRMKPLGQGDLFGRSGLLTHSYLMGPNGDSNGCVSFKDYAAFLQAFKAGTVRRLIVVPSLTDPAVVTAQKT